MGRTPAEEWRHNHHRRKACAAVILAPDEQGNPPACAICGQPGADSVDHRLPKAKFPDLLWELGNMQPAHEDCNKSKGDSFTRPGLGGLSEQW